MRKREDISSFENSLQQLVLILEPLARACKCLESSKATAGDVYLFWLAVLATCQKMSSIKFAESLMHVGRNWQLALERVFIYRLFFLTIDTSKVQFSNGETWTQFHCKQLYPQTRLPKTVTAPLAPDLCDAHLRETMPAYSVAGKYLLTVLMEEIRSTTTPEVFNSYDSTESIISAFRGQFALYTC